MASETGRKGADLNELVEHAPRFDFYQAVRLLQGFDQDGRKVGASAPPDREAVRFRSNSTMAFAASDVQAIQVPAKGQVPRVTVNFVGVATPASFGSLPAWYSIAARDALRQGRTELPAFFEVFDDRLIAFMFRAWQKHFLPAGHEASARGPAYLALLSSVGLGTDGLAGRLRCDERAIVEHAGLLARRPVTAAALADLVADYFGLACSIEECSPSTATLTQDEQLRLGDPEARLGVDTVLGSRVSLPQNGFRVVLGPLSLPEFRSLQPTAPAFAALVDLVRFGVGPEFDFDVKLVLHRDEVPQLRLTLTPDPDTSLGWSSWLGVRLQPTHADDAVCPASYVEKEPR